MEVDEVETGDIGEDEFHEPDVMGECVLAIRIAPQSAGARGDEPGSGLRVAARKQRDLVSESNQLLREIRHDTLGAAVQVRGDALVQGGHLCDSDDVFSRWE